MKGKIIRLTCKALLFDLDGVLVDSTACIERTWRSWSTLHGLDAEIVVHAAHGRRAVETVQRMALHLDAAREVAALVALESTVATGVLEVAGARNLLSSLPVRSWAIVTSAVRAVAEHRLRLVGLPIPQTMVCADEIARGKPEPDGYLAAASQLRVAAQDCLVVEDSPAGIAAARAALMRVIAVATTHDSMELSDASACAESVGELQVRVSAQRQFPQIEITTVVTSSSKNDHTSPP